MPTQLPLKLFIGRRFMLRPNVNYQGKDAVLTCTGFQDVQMPTIEPFRLIFYDYRGSHYGVDEDQIRWLQ